MFRPSDQRRVQAAFDAGLPAPYEAEITLAQGRKVMRCEVRDPENDQLVVVQAEWWYDERAPRTVQQPAKDEIAAVTYAFIQLCEQYPARKATEAAQQAEKEARQAALAAAKLAEAQPEG